MMLLLASEPHPTLRAMGEGWVGAVHMSPSTQVVVKGALEGANTCGNAAFS